MDLEGPAPGLCDDVGDVVAGVLLHVSPGDVRGEIWSANAAAPAARGVSAGPPLRGVNTASSWVATASGVLEVETDNFEDDSTTCEHTTIRIIRRFGGSS